MALNMRSSAARTGPGVMFTGTVPAKSVPEQKTTFQYKLMPAD